MLNYSCRSPLESSFVFWKSGENFNLEELINPMLAGYNFTENFTVDVAVDVTVSPSEFIDQLLKVISFQEKVQAVWFFEETKRINSCLTHCSQKINKKTFSGAPSI